MKQYSIRQQVIGLTFIPLIVMAVGLEAFFLHDRFSDMDKELLNKGELIAHQLAASSEYGVFSNNQEFLQNIANGALKQTDVRGVAVLNSASDVLVSAGEFSRPLKEGFAGRVSTLEPMDIAALLPPPQAGTHSLWLYHAIVPVQITLDEGGEKTEIKPIGAIVVEISRLRHEDLKARMLWTTLSATALFLALVSYLVYLASRSIIDPVQGLSRAVQDIGRGKLDTRVALDTRVRELATLAQGLNETTENLQQERESLQKRVDEATQVLRERKDEAERSSQGKSHFLAVASHDLRQPLHALGLFVAELQCRVSGAEQLRLVRQIGYSIESLSALLNALLDISKLDAGVIVPQIQPCNVATMLEHIATDYRGLAEQKNIRLIVRSYRGSASSDPQLLERILVNLVSNAIRYTSLNGCVLIACRKRGAGLRIEVRDNGVGIAKADQGNIFREFFQVEQSRLDPSKGLGLGLSIVNRLVKLLGHRIELRSAPDKGTVFALEVPVACDTDKIAGVDKADLQPLFDPGSDDGSPLSGKRLLVVDDDLSVLSGTASLLCSWGCIVNPVVSFAQVEQLLHDGAEWDFIVSDYQLGDDKNGIDIITLVRGYQNKQIPCILISGETSMALRDMTNANGYQLLQKPVRPAKLRSLMVYLLGEADEAGLD